MSPKELLTLTGLSLTIVVTVLGILWAVGRRHFDGQVFEAHRREADRFQGLVVEALTAQKPRLRTLYEELFAQELVRGRETDERSRRTHDAVTAVSAEVRELRAALEPKLIDIVQFGKTVVDLDQTLRELHRMMADFRKDFNENNVLRGEQIAELRGIVAGDISRRKGA